MSAATAAIVFNMMCEDNNRREREARNQAQRAEEEKLRHPATLARGPDFRRASGRKSLKTAPKSTPKTADAIDDEIISSLPARNGVIRLI